MSSRHASGGRAASASRLMLVVGVLSSASPAIARADWPVYGHDLLNSRSAATDGPSMAQVRSLRQAWVFKSSTGDFTCTPVVAGGVLVAGNNGGWVYALNAVTGRQLWSRDVGHPVNGSAAIDVAAPGGPTAFVPVAETDRPHVVALNLATGAVRWRADLTTQAGSSVFGSPTFWDG